MKTEMDFACRHVGQTQIYQINYEVQTELYKKEGRQLGSRCRKWGNKWPVHITTPAECIDYEVLRKYGLRTEGSPSGFSEMEECLFAAAVSGRTLVSALMWSMP